MSGFTTDDMVQMPKAQAEVLQKAHKLLEQLLADPGKGIETQRKLKEIDPSLRFPALDSEPLFAPLKAQLDETAAALKRIVEDRAAEKKEAAEKDQEGKLRTGLGDAKKRFQLTDDGLDGVMKLMQERQIADPEAAASLYVSNLPKPKPASPSTATFAPHAINLFGSAKQAEDENIKALHDNPQRWQDDMVASLLADTPLEAV